MQADLEAYTIKLLEQELILLQNIVVDMEMINIIPSESKLWEEVWRLYTESFPECERRRISSHRMAVDDSRFHTKVVVDNGNLLALMFYWILEKDRIYIEHIAVNPLMRGQNIGSEILLTFSAQNPDAEIILEIDPPVDNISIRRLGFYERLGFKNTGFSYNHPSYRKNSNEHNLLILSYPRMINDKECKEFVRFMNDNILKYID